MKAAYYEGFGNIDDEQIKIGELKTPEPGEGEVLVRMKAAGVNPVDAFAARGMLKDAIPCKFPLIPGWDVAGVVESCGHAASRFKPGDEVFAYARRPELQHGSFAEYICLPEAYLAHAPEDLSIEEAGAMPLVGLTAWQALFDTAKLEKGQTLLLVGASGGVGSVAIQLAKNAGAKVIGVASEKNHVYLKQLGADSVIDYRQDDVREAVTEASGGSIDVLFDCSRGDVPEKTHDLLKEGGHFVSVTNSNPARREDVHFTYVFVEPNAVELEELARLSDEGKLRMEVTKTYPLEQSAAALRDVEQLHTKGKVVITM
jgi:NADPH:quinone reductase-like Zn-dependent oxidoreductase